MLFDPKWEVEVKADPFSLEGLIAWLEKQPADKTYCYGDGGACLIHQYLTSCGIKVGRVWSGGRYSEGDNWESPKKPTSHEFWQTSIGNGRSSDYTFGSALKRARAWSER
jgi:hypothetical protein